jgi:hypothetical protein
MFTVIGIITTVILAKIALRAVRHRFGHRHGGCGGGFRRHAWRHWQRHNAFDLGDFGGHDDDLRDWSRGRGRGQSTELRAQEILSGLELNERQRAEAGDVLAVLRSARVGQLPLALRACSRPSFDADLAAAAIGAHASRDAMDALEHLHTILTEEQRALLDRLTARA